MAVDMVAILDRLGAQVAGLGPVEFHMMIGAQPFHYGIETFPRPVEPLTKTMDGDPIATVAEAVIGRLELLT